jgi:hypothetical protein
MALLHLQMPKKRLLEEVEARRKIYFNLPERCAEGEGVSIKQKGV